MDRNYQKYSIIVSLPQLDFVPNSENSWGSIGGNLSNQTDLEQRLAIIENNLPHIAAYASKISKFQGNLAGKSLIFGDKNQ
jgi:hypothetical protein